MEKKICVARVCLIPTVIVTVLFGQSFFPFLTLLHYTINFFFMTPSESSNLNKRNGYQMLLKYRLHIFFMIVILFFHFYFFIFCFLFFCVWSMKSKKWLYRSFLNIPEFSKVFGNFRKSIFHYINYTLFILKIWSLFKTFSGREKIIR